VSMSPPDGGPVERSFGRAGRGGVGDDNGEHPRPFDPTEPKRFCVRGFIKAIEEGDPEAQIRAYADEATVQVIDPDHPPRSPKLLAGRADVAAWIHETCSIKMLHRVVDVVEADPWVVFTDEMCDRHGTQMASTTTVTVKHGLIVQQRMILVWDDWDEAAY